MGYKPQPASASQGLRKYYLQILPQNQYHVKELKMAQRAKSLNQIKGKATTVTCTPNDTTTITDAMELSLAETQSLLCAVTFTGVSVAGSITLKLQDSRDGGSTWQDVKTQAVSASTTYELENNTQKTADTLVWPLVRLVVVSTNAGDTATVSAVYIARGA